MIKQEFTDYNIRIWGDTTFIEGEKIDYIYDSKFNMIGIQHCGLDNNQEKKVVKMLKEISSKIRELDEYLNKEKGGH